MNSRLQLYMRSDRHVRESPASSLSTPSRPASQSTDRCRDERAWAALAEGIGVTCGLLILNPSGWCDRLRTERTVEGSRRTVALNGHSSTRIDDSHEGGRGPGIATRRRVDNRGAASETQESPSPPQDDTTASAGQQAVSAHTVHVS